MKTNTKFDYKRFLTENMLETNMTHSDILTAEVKEAVLNLLLDGELEVDAIKIEGYKDTDGYSISWEEDIEVQNTFVYEITDQNLKVVIHLHYDPEDWRNAGGLTLEVEIYPKNTPMDYDKYEDVAEALENYLRGYTEKITTRLDDAIDYERYNSQDDTPDGPPY